MSNKNYFHDEAQRPRLSAPAPHVVEDSRNNDQYFFPEGFPVAEAQSANMDVSSQFRPGPQVCSEIFFE